jgi:hypothetical protein
VRIPSGEFSFTSVGSRHVFLHGGSAALTNDLVNVDIPLVGPAAASWLLSRLPSGLFLWTPVVAHGDVPPARAGACVVAIGELA